jgi:hypothetical protein
MHVVYQTRPPAIHKKSGTIALPHNPMIMIEAPSRVNLPRPSNANGQMPALQVSWQSKNREA